MAQQLPPTDQQSTGQLFRRIVNGLNGLVNRQIQLVKQEIKEDIFEVLKASKTLAIGAGIAIVGALILLNVAMLMLILGFNEIGNWLVPGIGRFLGWLLAIILLVVVFFVAYRFVRRGIQEVKISPVARTRTTLGEDVQWARQLLTRNGK
ncbi:MAG: phage holin family protein [Chloroflexi bacterium]|nr:phage holin family protein [Chloroflexota bacterium]